MTRICGNASEFAQSALHGYSLVHRDIMRMVRGGVVRAKPGRAGKVAVVVGGGSGHYPAFNGYVGTGFADAAVAGDIFASPSTQAIYSVARRAERGGGVILGFGNYAGDVLNFGIAAERLRREVRNVGRIVDKINLILRHWSRLSMAAPVQTYLPHGWQARAILPA